MADASLDVPRWFILVSNHVTSWVDARADRGEPFSYVEQEADHTVRIYSRGRKWRLTRTTKGVLLMWDDDRSGMFSVSVSFPKETAEANAIAILQEYVDRWDAQALAEALA